MTPTFRGIFLTGLTLISTVLMGRINYAQAAPVSPTPPITPPTTITIPENLAASWQGYYTLPATSVIRREVPSLEDLLKHYVGQAVLPQTGRHTYYYNPEAIYRWLEQTVGAEWNVPAQEPSLTIENGRAVNFQPPQNGQAINFYQTTLNVISALEHQQYTANLIMNTTAPATKLNDLNNLGINELISRGESTFAGSPANRRHNIAVGVEKMKGVIIAPGDEFSFNKYLGPVEAYTGFLPELVIKANGTIPEFGGGLCQVSSTTFRAAMQAGLPITQRRNHSYAVSYYAPQGTDATIYPGVIDLKFINDTPGSILIWPYFKDNNTLIFDFYGTKDDRQVILATPVQYDRKPDGSMKASWTRTVIKNGVKDVKTYNSTYLPPALFHKQETFVANPTSPAPGTPNTNPGSTPATPSAPTVTPPTNSSPATATSSPNPITQ